MPLKNTQKESHALKALKASPMFQALDDATARQLMKRCLKRSYQAGENVFRAGEPADRFYVILSGRVKIYKISPKGDEQIMHLYGPGRTFGEAAMWAGVGFPAYADAKEDATLLIVSRQALRDALSSDPDLTMGMLAGLSIKLQEFARLIEDLSLREVPARLAGSLLRESKKAGSKKFELRVTKRELAAQIGTIAETLSRAFAKLKSSGLIGVQGSTVTILDEKGLRSFSESE